MKLFSGLITILFALLISATAAWFSVAGLVALFAATAIPVMIMGIVLESSKLVAAGWLHANWKNSNVNFVHKSYLTLAVLALMLITSIGIYGFLSKGHLEQAAPVAGIELQVNAKQQQIQMLTDTNTRLTTQLKQLDASVDALMANNKTTQSLRVRASQGKERASVQKQMDDNNAQIQKLEADILPLKQQTAEVEAKLGPVKYVAQLFGWQDTDKAVRLVILVIMFAFDPLAVILLISATISFSEYAEEKRAKKANAVPVETAAPSKLSSFFARKPKVEEPEVTNEDMRVYSAAQAYAQTLVAKDDVPTPVVEQTPDETAPIDTMEELAPATDAIVSYEDTPPLMTEAEQESMNQIRASLEDMHGRIEPKFGEPAPVVDAEEPTLEVQAPAQVDDDKLDALRATDTHAPETVATVEVAQEEVTQEVPQEPVVTTTIPVQEKVTNDKERLIEILEKRPEILQDLIDVISTHRQQEEAKHDNGPKPWIR